MGYYTYHNLEIVSGDTETNHEENISKIADEPVFDENCKWYESEETMREYSKSYPETIFKLIGQGEESEDVWHQYYKNGLMQNAPVKMIFDEFDETKLK